MAKQQRRKKYAFGSPVIEDPSVALTNDQIAQAKAQVKANKDPLVQGLNMFGNLAMGVGQGMMSKGMAAGEGADGKGVAGFLNKNQGSMDAMFGVLGGTSMGNFALGGIAIKPSKKGTFTAAATKHGKSVQAFAAQVLAHKENYTPAMVKKANFARNAKKWKHAMGGVAQDVDIEAEGNEIIQAPGGQPMELNGASHANGGIDLTVPEGTEIYSQQLKGPDGKTMAQRKKIREGRVAKVSKPLSEAPTDKLLRNALARTKQGNAVVDAQDMNKMKMAQLISQMGQAFASGGVVKKYANGGPIEDELLTAQQLQIPGMVDPSIADLQTTGQPAQNWYDSNPPMGSASYINPTAPGSTATPNTTAPQGFLGQAGSMLGDLTKNITTGDALGLYGQYKASTDPMKNTLAQRASDQANVNAFKDFGKAGLAEMDKARGYQMGQRASALGDVNLDRVASSSRNRAGARGINTLRALDIATDVQAQKAKESVNNQYNQLMGQMFEKTAGMQTQRDQAVMSGEERRQQADRADKDAYYSAMAKDIATKNTGTQYIAKNLNEMKTRESTEKLMQKYAPNFKVDMNGNVTKGGVTVGKASDYELVNGVMTHKKTGKQLKDTE